MKDDEYFGFSTYGDFKVANLPDDVSGGEDDFKLVDVVDFGTEDDVRIVRLSDVNNFHDVAVEQDAKRNWMSQINSMKRKHTMLHSSSGLKPRCTRRRRMVQSAMVAVLVVVIFLVFTGTLLNSARTGVQTTTASASAPQSASMAPVIEPPANAVPLIIDDNHFYIQMSTDWAHILLDGHALQYVPVPGIDPPLRIPDGHHLIIWRTHKQQIYSCTMSVPPSLMDTCTYDGPETLQNGISVWIIANPHFKDGTP